MHDIKKLRLGILGSTRGTHLATLHAAIKSKQLTANIEIVISNKKDAYILERARDLNLSAQFIDTQNLSREKYDEQISNILQMYQIDLIVLVGYMRILSKDFVLQWQNKIINVHPSLLPDFAGQMDLAIHAAVLAEKRFETGCTVHYVTEEVDAGPIILQEKCAVFGDDTAQSLKQRVQSLEGDALIKSLQIIQLQ